MSKGKDTRIKIDVQLDENKIPEDCLVCSRWRIERRRGTTLLMSLWDGKNQRPCMDLGKRNACRSNECFSSILSDHGADILSRYTK